MLMLMRRQEDRAGGFADEYCRAEMNQVNARSKERSVESVSPPPASTGQIMPPARAAPRILSLLLVSRSKFITQQLWYKLFLNIAFVSMFSFYSPIL